MTLSVLDRLLDGRLSDPDGPGTLSVSTRQVLIASGLGVYAASLLERAGMPRDLCLVSDANCWAAMGQKVAGRLEAAGYTLRPVIFDAPPHADEAAVARVEAGAAGAAGLIAVGGGTVSDLAKHVAHHSARPYAVFGTALSMNGYGSANAAITVHGHKKSLPSTAPVAIFLDLDVLAAAPPRLARAGLGDSVCRATAQFDWLLSHLLLDRPYRQAPFALLAQDEPPLFDKAAGIGAGDRAALAALARTLVLSGFGMVIAGSSNPASQGEHLISHYIDMLGDPAWGESLHGEHIAVTTLTIAGLQERLLAGDAPVLRPSTETRADFIHRYGEALGASCWAEYQGKQVDAAKAQALNARLGSDWPEIRARLAAVARPRAEIDRALQAAGAPRVPSAIHVPDAFYARAVHDARDIRDRYTILDIARDSGLLQGAGDGR
ncbi:iron-containing alcohol dehydrogenase [Oleomonas cavernae]|uniref:Iron-containing alcohol dehydrogenase n=1 Tax=Oleomonas cavernae TaxID=2320859 RepID=A0A418WEA1_9PROT|nr:iron-containing alcohol dehydrogenase [Oleomonas cavernae]RJF88355.1 iron-containing alcohol dehydrogenase [Oleomonas cavernae]